MAGLLDWQTDDERAAQQRALQAYSNQIGQQQARQEVWDALGQTLPAQIVKSIYQAARLPGDVYQGKVDPQSPEAIGRAADLAGAAITGSMPFAVRGALGSGGGKMVQPQTAEEALTLYHGSPHNFDKFDISKIGSGDGAQRYGHGLYFAEREGLAKRFREGVKDSAAINEINKRMDELSRVMDTDRIAGQYGKFKSEVGQNAFKEYNDLMDKRQAIVDAKGHMYQVAVKADRNSFMDYDKAFKDQPEAVRAALTPERLGLKPAGPFPGGNNYGWVDETGKPVGNTKRGSLPDSIFEPGATPASIMGFIGRGNAELAAQKLREAGVPGVRYFEDRTAVATGKESPSNYVVFDDSLIDILRKYGLVGLLGGGAVAAGANAPKPIKREDIERGLL